MFQSCPAALCEETWRRELRSFCDCVINVNFNFYLRVRDIEIKSVFMRVKDNHYLTSSNSNINIGYPVFAIEMDNMTPEYTFISADEIKSEPMSPPETTRVRKRTASQASWEPTTNTASDKRKKPKKYQLDPSSDPSVKNAVAAKLNRDKKKQEELKLKADNENLRARNLELQKRLQEAFEVQAELRRELEEERAKNSQNGQDSFTNVGAFFKDIETDLNSKNAIGNDDLDNIDVHPSIITDFDYKEYIDHDWNLFPSPGSPEKITGIEHEDLPSPSCLSMDSNHSLSELSSCLDPVLAPSLRSDGSNNGTQRNLMGEFNNIMKYLSE